MKKIVINGFGRIGRLFFRQIFNMKDVEIVAINDLGDVDNLAYLLRHDSVYGLYPHTVSVERSEVTNALLVNGIRILFLNEHDATKLPWKELKVDVVVESTGVFESYEKAKVHIIAGAKRVIITAPAKDEDGKNTRTVLMGVNEKDLDVCTISSNGSCTTNAVSPVIAILHEAIGIEKAILNTVHGYTATQNIVDGPVTGTDFRRGRAAAENIVPSTTGAAIAVTRAMSEFKEKFDGIALRVPVIAGSLADITFIASRETSVAEVNYAFRKAAQDPRWKGILKITEEQLVSSDIVGEPYGAIIDLSFTKVVGGNLVKVFSWYDNEWGYAATLVKHIEAVIKSIK